LAGTVYYPTDGNPPYASVAIVPGFTAYQDSIAGWGPFLASHGVAVITIDTITPADLPPVREAALMDALETMKAENTRSGGPLSGKLDISRQGVMGWSMGGGGTLLAANDNPTLKSAISLAGWNPLGEYTNNKVPSLMFASLGDPLAGGQSQGFYDSIPDSTPKMMIEWPGFDHSVANDPTGMSGEVGRFGLSWQEVYLKGNECYRKYLKETPTGTTEFKSNQ
jgi:dienelactone hydrolase